LFKSSNPVLSRALIICLLALGLSPTVSYCLSCHLVIILGIYPKPLELNLGAIKTLSHKLTSTKYNRNVAGRLYYTFCLLRQNNRSVLCSTLVKSDSNNLILIAYLRDTVVSSLQNRGGWMVLLTHCCCHCMLKFCLNQF
jgi:hypothetical protein